MEEHLTPTEVPILTLDCADSWNRLTENEKKYAHYIAKGMELWIIECYKILGSMNKNS